MRLILKYLTFVLALTSASSLSALSYQDLDENTRITLDDEMRIVEETITGTLTGTSAESESYTIRYSYSKDGYLTKKQEDNGITTLLSYNDDGEVTEISICHEGHEKKLSFIPSIKNPTALIESYCDPESQSFTEVRRIECGYDNEAKLLYQQFFNGAGNLEKELFYHYDALGNRIGIFDENGSGIEQQFSPAGDLLSNTIYNQSLKNSEQIFCYNEERLPLIQEKNSIPTSNEYNDKNELIAEVDILGNRIEYFYDNQGRLIQAIYPWTLDCDDQPYQPQQRWVYNEKGQVIRHTDLRGDTIEIFYTSRNQPYKISYPDGSFDLFEYNLDGTPKGEHKPSYTPPQKKNNEIHQSLQHIAYTIDTFGQQVIQHTGIDDQLNKTIITLDALGRIAEVVKYDNYGEIILHQENRYDGVGNKTLEKQLFKTPDGSSEYVLNRWEYGPKGRLERQFAGYTLPDQQTTHLSYTPQGQLKNITKPDGTLLEFEYNNKNCISRLSSSDGTIDYLIHYDRDQITLIEDLAQSTENLRLYNEQGQIIQETLGNGLTLHYTYDTQGKRDSCLLPNGTSIVYEWNEQGLYKIHRLKRDGSIRYTHTYSKDRSSDELIANEGLLSLSFDDEGVARQITTSLWSELIPEEGKDSEGNITHVLYSDSQETQSHQYRYDGRSRLAEEDNISHKYDTLNNRYSLKNTRYNSHCQLLEEDTTQFYYDSCGNLIKQLTPHESVQYRYDALNRMTEVILSNGLSYSYTYDYFNRRLSKTYYKNGNQVSTERYLYDNQREIGAVNEAGALFQLRVLGIGIAAEIGAAVAIELNGKTYVPIHDHRGSVACLIRNNKVIEKYNYQAFGSSTPSQINNPWRFASKRHDNETGFIYFGKRYYDAERGRWTTQDPLGFIEGMNRYQFAGNNPLADVDMHGCFSLRSTWCSLYDTWDSFYTKAQEAFTFADEFVKKHLSFESNIKTKVDETMKSIFGEVMLVLTGYHGDTMDVGVYGKGELNDKVRITVINGILNIRSWAENNARLLSKTHADINVHYIFRPTRGWTQDLVKGTLVKFGYASQEARFLAHTWKQLIQEMGGVEGGGIIIHYAHSIGGADTAIARQFLTPEEQKMIRVISLGSPMVIPHEGFHSVVNYMSLRDGIFFLAPLSHLSTLFTHDHNIIYLDTYWGIPIIDHLMNRGSYRTLLETLGHEFIEEFASEKFL